MQPLEIIGAVAAARLREIIAADGTRALFGIMGLSPAVTSVMARHLAAIPNVGKVEVFVHPSLEDGDTGLASVSTRTATWHRNHPTPGVRATVFSVPAVQIRAIEQSLGHVVRIDEAWLRERPVDWAEVALSHALPETRASFAEMLDGLLASDLVVTAPLLARFCSRVAETMKAGSMLENAVGESLPALRLPRNPVGGKQNLTADAAAARAFFQRMRAEAQPFLYRRTREGETLASGDLRRKLDELEAAQAISHENAERIGALCDDRNVRDGQWSAAQAEAAEIPWDQLSAVFTQTKRTEKPTFGSDTQRLFDQEYRNTLTKEEKEFLDGLKTDVATPGPKIDQFWETHRDRLKSNPPLYRRWEKLIFKKPIEVEDLGEGLLRLVERVCSEADIGEDARVQIRLRGSDQASFWANPKLRHQLLYLRDRYRGLDGLLAPEIAFDLGLCWSSKWEDQSSDGQSGTNSIEFEAFLVDKADLADAKGGKLKSAAARAQMLWRPPSDAVAYSLPSDLRHVRPADVENAHLLTGKVAENRRARGGATGIDLEDAGTLVDAFGRSSGSLANPERAENHVGRRFDQLLAELESDTVVNAEGALAIRAAMSAFRSAYTKAVGALIDGPGLASPSLVSQAERFGNLFDALREHAPSESGLRELVSPLLDIGCIEVEGRRPAAIVAAWHPLRLAEIGAKAAQLAAAAKAVVRSSVERRTGARDFLESRVRTLAGTYYADLGRSGGARPRLLAQTQRVLDCGMLEEAEGEGVRNIGEEGAKEAVEALQRISKEYLELRPHERSNFSITLLGAESDDIPVLLAKSLDRLVDENPDIRCDLVVTHDDPLRLRELYESQNRRMAADLDTSAASGLSRSFLSRLRVSLVGPDRLVPAEGGKASDIVLLQDVIARSAMVRWMEAEVQTDSPSIADHVPTARSKRLPFRKRSVESGLFLTSPVQPAAVVSWSNALHDVVVKQNTTPAGPWLPLRWAEFDDTGVSDVLRRAHSLANWVVTFDRIADRRLIVQDDRRIIRYFSTPNSAHNVIVSAEVTTSDLGDRLKGDLTQLLPNATPDERAAVLKRLHKTAARLSGAVVMRAAQWRNYAQELLGLVLAERRLEGLLEADGEHATALFFLDDNRQWLDLKGEMADILAVAFSAVDDRPKIRVVVAEAKYCTAANVPAHRATSLRQTEATYTELARRLLQPETSLDPTIWRDRIADMLLEQMDPFDVVGGINQSDWIEALRQQTVPIEVSAHSMVFSHDLPGVHADKAILPDEGLPPEDRRPLAQWVHGRSEVVELLLGLGRGDPPPSLPLPADWPAGGAAARSPESGDSTPHGGQSHDPKAVAEQNESTTVAADGEASNDVSDQTVTSGSLANAGPLAARAEGEPTPPGESAELPADGRLSDRPLANGPAANEGAAHLGTGTGQIGARKADGPVVHSGTAQDRRAEVDPAATDSRPEVPIGEAALTAAAEEGWAPPILAALRRMSHAESQAAGEAWLEQKVHDLQNALQAEGMDAPIVESRLTPNSGLVYVGARTLTIAWLERRQTDLLTKHRIEIVRISPMPGSIAIAIRRPQRSVLHLADAWLRRNPSVGPGPEERFAPVVGEKEDDGALLHLPLAGPFAGQERAAPHALISGNTGSGKGILVTNLMLDLCALNAPRDIDLYLIDPKRGVDYGWARRLPHLRRGIVADQPEAIALLEELVAEMEERYDLISDRGFRNIDQYNLRVAAAERLPRVVIFFDEVANWMQDDGFKKEVESLLNKIATKARAAGLHLFMVYQRADVQVITMQLRTNLGNRLILRLPDEGSSKIALGEKGAERLLGKGHVIAKLDSDEKIYTQVPFIGDEEVEDLVDAIAAAWGGLDPRSD